MAIDLSVEIKTGRGTLVLRNPLLPGSSEVAADELTIRKCIENGVGAIVTKSVGHLNSPPGVITTSKPWAFPLDRFGRQYQGAWLFQAGYSAQEENFEKMLSKAVPAWHKICREAGVPLINSILEASWGMEPEEITQTWVYIARRLEAAGSDAIELDASCLAPKLVYGKGGQPIFTSEEMWSDEKFSCNIIKKVMAVTRVPIGAKFGIFHNPLGPLTKAWAGEGINFVSGHNCLPGGGVFIDVEREEVFGTPGESMFIAGPTMVPLSLNRLSQVLRIVDIPVIGCGGIYSASDVIQYLLIGCAAVQVSSAAFHSGHKIYRELLKGLEDWMKRHGYSRIDQFRGKLLEPASGVRADWEEKYGYNMPPYKKGQEFKYVLTGGKSPSPVVPRVDREKCVLCGACNVCLYGVLEIDKGKKKLNINDILCMGCGICVGKCPQNPGVIWLEDKRTGEMVWDGAGMVKTFKKKETGGYSWG